MFTHTPRGHGRAPAAELDSGQVESRCPTSVLSHNSVSALRAESESEHQDTEGHRSPLGYGRAPGAWQATVDLGNGRSEV